MHKWLFFSTKNDFNEVREKFFQKNLNCTTSVTHVFFWSWKQPLSFKRCYNSDFQNKKWIFSFSTVGWIEHILNRIQLFCVFFVTQVLSMAFGYLLRFPSTFQLYTKICKLTSTLGHLKTNIWAGILVFIMSFQRQQRSSKFSWSWNTQDEALQVDTSL